MVSERDREYMRRLGELKAASHEEAAAAHRALPLAERLERSWRLYEAHRSDAPLEHTSDALELYERARRLGLYRP